MEALAFLVFVAVFVGGTVAACWLGLTLGAVAYVVMRAYARELAAKRSPILRMLGYVGYTSPFPWHRD